MIIFLFFFSDKGRERFNYYFRLIFAGSDEKFPLPKCYSLKRGQFFPEKLSVFEYRFDGIGKFLPWLEAEVTISSEALHIGETVIPTTEMVSSSFWIDICNKECFPLLLTGPSGTGKTSIINSFLKKLSNNSYVINRIFFSPFMSSEMVSFKNQT